MRSLRDERWDASGARQRRPTCVPPDAVAGCRQTARCACEERGRSGRSSYCAKRARRSASLLGPSTGCHSPGIRCRNQVLFQPVAPHGLAQGEERLELGARMPVCNECGSQMQKGVQPPSGSAPSRVGRAQGGGWQCRAECPAVASHAHSHARDFIVLLRAPAMVDAQSPRRASCQRRGRLGAQLGALLLGPLAWSDEEELGLAMRSRIKGGRRLALANDCVMA